MFPACLLGHAIFKLTYLSNHDYKPLYFESDAATVNEIVLKVRPPLRRRQPPFISHFLYHSGRANGGGKGRSSTLERKFSSTRSEGAVAPLSDL